MQQQNYSLEALSKRDALDDPFGKQGTPEAAGTSSDDSSPAGQGSVQQEALNGAQVTALQGIITAVASGELGVDTAQALIQVAFPLVPQDQIDAMLQEARLAAGDGTQPAVDEESKKLSSELFFMKALQSIRESLND